MNVQAPIRETGTEVAIQTAPPPVRRPAEVRVVNDPIAVLDTARFEHMQRIANVMAHSNLIPDSLCSFKNEETNKKEFLPIEQVAANCFLVVNQAVRWNMDPFAVAQCVSVVHGKLCYEGKLIAAVTEGKLGYELEYEISGQGDAMKVVVMATWNGKPVLDSKGRPKVAEGTVGEWKTTNSGSPWAARGGHPRMLRYRGAREWCRIHAPGLMLGVYSDDEMEDLRTRHIPEEVPPAPPPAPVIEHQPQPEPAQTIEQLVEGGNSVEPKSEVWEEEPVEDAPPVPPATATAAPGVTAADLTAPVEAGVTHAVTDVFPGDLPPPKSTDHPLDIPPALRRTASGTKTEETVDVVAWLEELKNRLSGCETIADLSEIQSGPLKSKQGRVSRADYAKGQSLVMEAFHRISGDDGDEEGGV